MLLALLSGGYQLISKLYIPLGSILIVFLVGNRLGGPTAFNPLTTAQNPRVRFQPTGGTPRAAVADAAAGQEVRSGSGLVPDGVASGRTARLLYIGDSQTLAIMDAQPGEMTAPRWLEVELARQDTSQRRLIDVRVASLPNLTMPEFLIRVVAAGERAPSGVDILLASAVLEEFRGLGVRDQVLRESSQPNVRGALRELSKRHPDLRLGRTALAAALSSQVSGAQDGAATFSERDSARLAARAEARLQAWAQTIPLFARRAAVYGQISLSYHAWRNRLLGITSTTARPVPDATYYASLELIELTLRYARAKGIRVVFYLAPIRPVKPNPSLPTDVTRFRAGVPALCRRYAVPCLDYVDLIPESLWTNYPDNDGAYRGGRDFAHFTGAAHRLLAERLVADVGPQIFRWARARADVHQ